MIIRDRFALGTLAAIVASLPQSIFNAISVQLGIAKYYDFQISGSIYLFKNLTLQPWGIFLGGVTWIFMASLLGVVISYIIFWTGRDFWWLKGALISIALMYTMIYGFVFSMGGPKIVPWDIGTNVSLFFDNLLFGVLVGYFIVRWGGIEKQG